MRYALRLLAYCAAVVVADGAARANISFQRYITDDQTPYLVAAGEFEQSDSFAGLWSEIIDQRPAFITFDSRGGSVASAMRLGRMIRLLELSTIQVKAFECSSACALAFLGGVFRYAEPGSLGVHKSSFGDTTGMDVDDAVSQTQAGLAAVIGYLKEMEVDPGLLELSLQYESWDIRYLSLTEMIEFGVIKLPPDEEPQTRGQEPHKTIDRPHPSSSREQRHGPPPATARLPENQFTIPEAKSGWVRHPSGAVTIRAMPNSKGVGIVRAENGTQLQILDNTDRWYRVRAGTHTGYAHHTWVKVDQFHPSSFSGKFVQIKSFDNYAEAEQFVRSSSLRLGAYLATNGWFAITLDGEYEEEQADRLLRTLKAQGRVPADSYKTYGNTYVRKVCCE